MFNNHQRSESPPSNCERNSPTASCSSTPSVISAGFSPAQFSANSLPSTNADDNVSENGMNNNGDHSLDNGEQEELSSDVVIEIVDEEPMEQLAPILEDIETEMDDGQASSQDDGMISAGDSNTSSSIISIDHNADIPAAASPAHAAIDQPEVADFLDMDFDVEPSSGEEEEGGPIVPQINLVMCRQAKELSQASGSYLEVNTASNAVFHRKDRVKMEEDDHLYSAPGTSFHDNSSTAPKNGYVPSCSTDVSICVHGCPACISGNHKKRNRDSRSPSSFPSDRSVPIWGHLHTSAASNAERSYASLQSNFGFHRALSSAALRHRRGNANIGGPDGLILSRSVYVDKCPWPSRAFCGLWSDDSCWFGTENGARYFVWTMKEAERIQATQIGPSACGATALINVLRALGGKNGCFDYISIRDVERAVPTRLRGNDLPVSGYLFSRSVAGTDAEDLIAAADTLTNSRIVGRFFPMNETTIATPTQQAQFGRWLADWLERGAIPVLTLNMQRGVTSMEPVPDAWHHQMVFGVCTKTGNIYVTNPLESVPIWLLKHTLCSPSVLLVKAEDVRQRWQGRSADLVSLLSPSNTQRPKDSRPVAPVLWTEQNVLGQVAHVLRQTPEANRNDGTSEPIQSHICIPARYRSGVTLFALAGTETWDCISAHPSVEDSLSLSLSFPSTSNGDSKAVGTSTQDDTRVERSALEDNDLFRSSGGFDSLSHPRHCEHSQSCSQM